MAGESLELHFGVAFGLSTMAAAGFGNILSDIAGLGFADQVEVSLDIFLRLDTYDGSHVLRVKTFGNVACRRCIHFSVSFACSLYRSL